MFLCTICGLDVCRWSSARRICLHHFLTIRQRRVMTLDMNLCGGGGLGAGRGVRRSRSTSTSVAIDGALTL